jgi:hypothetical protein
MMSEGKTVEDPWMAAMCRGDLETAWRISDAVLNQRRREGIDCSAWPRHLQFIWNGDSLEGKRVLVRCYHGLGDTLQFIRFLPTLQARGSEVILWVQPALIPLLKHASGIDRLLPLHDGTPDCEYDVDIEIMELPHALRISARDLVNEPLYLDIAPRPRTEDTRLQVGLTWKAGEWNQSRSIPPEYLQRLSCLPNIVWHSLQYPPEALSFVDMNIACRNIHELAVRMRTLDLIISVDTMVAHLAGVLRMPVWTLLPKHADWRWSSDAETTLWYPTMRLLRQPRAGAWDSVIDRLIDLLLDQSMLPVTRCTRSDDCIVSSG